MRCKSVNKPLLLQCCVHIPKTLQCTVYGEDTDIKVCTELIISSTYDHTNCLKLVSQIFYIFSYKYFCFQILNLPSVPCSFTVVRLCSSKNLPIVGRIKDFLTLPYLKFTLPYLSIAYLTLPYHLLPYFTFSLPYLNLTLPSLTSPFLYLSFPYPTTEQPCTCCTVHLLFQSS